MSVLVKNGDHRLHPGCLIDTTSYKEVVSIGYNLGDVNEAPLKSICSDYCDCGWVASSRHVQAPDFEAAARMVVNGENRG